MVPHAEQEPLLVQKRVVFRTYNSGTRTVTAGLSSASEENVQKTEGLEYWLSKVAKLV